MLTASRMWHRKHRTAEAMPTVPRVQRGSLLLEASIAIAIFSFGVLGLLGVLASSIRAADEARLRSEAAQFAHAIVAEMWTTPATDLDARFAADGAAVGAWRNKVARLLPAATMSVGFAEPGLSAQSRSVVVTITWLLPGSTQRHRYVTSAQIGRNT